MITITTYTILNANNNANANNINNTSVNLCKNTGLVPFDIFEVSIC